MVKSEQEVKVISESFIKPNTEFVDEALKKPYHLSPMDVGILASHYMQRGLLYPKPSDEDFLVQKFLQKLKHSVSLSLIPFYPLVGRFCTKTFPDEQACCIFIEYSNSPGARFIHASVACTVSDVLSSNDSHPAFHSFFELGEETVNYDGHTKALLSIQATELIDGIFIGISINHSVGDGSSLVHYITALSEIFNYVTDSNNGQDSEATKATINKPIFETFFPEGYGPYLKIPLTRIQPDKFKVGHDPASPVREKIFHFSRASMSRLKAMANNNKSNHIEISSFKALASLIWRAVTRARKLDLEMETKCGLPFNARSRWNPPLSQAYFGNYFTGTGAVCKVGELLGNDLRWGAMLLHESVENMDDSAVRERIRMQGKTCFILRPDHESFLLGPNFVMIMWSPRFDFFRFEFGMGKPVAVRSGNGGKSDGKLSVSQGRQGAGSVDVEVCFAASTMSALEVDEEFMSYATFG